MWEDRGYIYVIYDFADYNRIDPIIVDFTKMGVHVADCSGSYDASLGTENEEELIEDSRLVLLFLTKHTGISHRLIGQLDLARRNDKRIIAILLDTLKEMTIPEDIMNFIQGQPKIKAYDYETYYRFLRGAKSMIKKQIQKSQPDKVLEYALRAGAIAMILILTLVGGKFIHARKLVHTLKDATVMVYAIEKDGTEEIYNGVYIDQKGIILTDAQAADAKTIWIESGIEKSRCQASVVVSEEDQGIALLSTDTACSEYIPYAGNELEEGEKIYTATYVEEEEEPAVYDGMLLQKEETGYEISLSDKFTFTYSGSPVIDKHGNVIGVICYADGNDKVRIFYDLEPLKSLLESMTDEKEGNGLPE